MFQTGSFLVKEYTQRHLYWLLFVGGMLLAVWLWIRSTGAANDDEIGHFLIARDAWRTPYLVLDLWGRPVNTLLYMPGVLFGLAGARATALIMTGLTVLATTHAARRLGLTRLYLIPLLFLFQPGVVDQAYAALTTVPFMLLLALAVVWWLDERYTLVSLAFACLTLTRHEGIALFGVWWLYMLYRREWRAAIFAWLPIALYNLVFFLVVAPPLQELPILTYFTPNRGDAYGSGSWLHFPVGLVVMSGIAVLLWAIYALPRLRQMHTRLLIFVPHVLYFLIHAILFRFGLFASGGYFEFLLPISPAMAIVSAIGAESVLEGLVKAARRKHDTMLRLVWAVLVVVPVVALALIVRPREINATQSGAQEAAVWLQTAGIPAERINAMYGWFYYFYDLRLKQFDGWIHLLPPEAMQAGDILVWDAAYMNVHTPYTYEALMDPANRWEQLASFAKDTVIIFQKR